MWLTAQKQAAISTIAKHKITSFFEKKKKKLIAKIILIMAETKTM